MAKGKTTKKKKKVKVTAKAAIKTKPLKKKPVAAKKTKLIKKKLVGVKNKVVKAKPTKPTKMATVKKVSSKSIKAKKTLKASIKSKGVVSNTPQALKFYGDLLTPLDDRILVYQEGENTGELRKTSGGLYIPDSVEESTQARTRGFVVQVGRGHMDKKGRIRPLDVKPGDEILFQAYGASKIFLNNKELLILRESDVLGILE